MIIKSGGIASGDGPRICNYAVAEGDNERVEVLKDENDQLLIADEFAELKSRKNGLLHIIISPDQELTPAELDRTLEAIRAEFGFNESDPETLSMHESKRADGSTQKHFHLVRPAQDSETGRTYKLFRSKAKDEAVSRLLEMQFGHTLTSGANNSFAEMRLREQGRADLADELAEAFADQDSPKAAYSSDDHQAAKRQNFDLPALRQQLKELAELPREQQPAALAELIDDQGLELAEAITEGRGRSRIMIETPEGIRDHNANRTLKIEAAAVAEFIHETKEILNDRRSTSKLESRPDLEGSAEPDHQRSGADSPEQQGSNSAHERPVENPASSSQELSESQQLAAAAESLRPQAKSFASNRAGDLTASDIEPSPDIDDPNLMRKLAAILKRQMEKTVALVRRLQVGIPPLDIEA